MKNIYISFILSVVLFGCASSDLKTDSPSASETPTDVNPAKINSPPTPLRYSMLQTKEMKGVCRKNVSEDGTESKKSKIKRLQDSYIFADKTVLWIVTSYSDKSCKRMLEAHRSEFQCDKYAVNQKALCKQIATASYVKGAWRNEKMIDHAGNTDILTMSYYLKADQEDKATLYATSISDEGEEQKEVLTF